MKRCIEDEFTRLPISRQRKYQPRMQRDQRCTECGEPAVQASRCLKHLIRARERQRRNRGLKRRYYGTLSYKLQLAAKGDSLSRAGAQRMRVQKSKVAKP
jgi:hypothetical protein